MISRRIADNLKNSSWIRAMFEEGEQLRKIYGPEKVFDFSLGNPDVEPPEAVKQAFKKIVNSDEPGAHGYMSNAGYTDVRAKIADRIKRESGMPLSYENIIMTCGAGGGLNVVLKTILDPGDEVIVFAPYFVEYWFYIDNHGGKVVILPADTSSFEPDAAALERSITPRTKAVIVNSPNNPSGVVYSRESLSSISSVIESKEKEYGTVIYVISDEPYREIVYDGIKPPNVFSIFKNSIIVYSFSKSLSLPGERIGYIAVNPAVKDVELMVNGLIFSNRILGFVNAPALPQKVVAEAIDSAVNVEEYRKRRDILYYHLIKLGFSCIKPGGAFYLFPKALIPDDIEFVKRALKYNLLLVPGKGFGCPGYFRMAYCVSFKIIENSLPAFEALAREFRA